jgi:hypothetical protein
MNMNKMEMKNMTRKIIDMQDEPEGTLLVFNEMIVTIQGGGITRVSGLKPTETQAAEIIQSHTRKILMPVQKHEEVEADSPLGAGAMILMKDGDVITEEQYLKEKAFMDRWWHGIGS